MEVKGLKFYLLLVSINIDSILPSSAKTLAQFSWDELALILDNPESAHPLSWMPAPGLVLEKLSRKLILGMHASSNFFKN